MKERVRERMTSSENMINFKLKSDKCQENISSKPEYSYSSSSYFLCVFVFVLLTTAFDESFYSLLLSYICLAMIIIQYKRFEENKQSLK